MSVVRCRELVHRRVTVEQETLTRFGPQNYDHWQECGRPVVDDDLCAAHLRRRDARPQNPPRLFKPRAWLGRVFR